jgi:N-carbamoyl-L-amino-acid hydrolase
LETLVDVVTQQANRRAERDGTGCEITAESRSAAVVFPEDLTSTVAGDRPVIPTAAGHDAGILAGYGIPTAMLFVRNPTGISHAPDEHAETADCVAGVEALADAVQRLAS